MHLGLLAMRGLGLSASYTTVLKTARTALSTNHTGAQNMSAHTHARAHTHILKKHTTHNTHTQHTTHTHTHTHTTHTHKPARTHAHNPLPPPTNAQEPEWQYDEIEWQEAQETVRSWRDSREA